MSLIRNFEIQFPEDRQEILLLQNLKREKHAIKEGQSRYLVEPNVKNGKGGLRDLESLSWMTILL